jgi:hypothetical protein
MPTANDIPVFPAFRLRPSINDPVKSVINGNTGRRNRENQEVRNQIITNTATAFRRKDQPGESVRRKKNMALPTTPAPSADPTPVIPGRGKKEKDERSENTSLQECSMEDIGWASPERSAICEGDHPGERNRAARRG